MEFCVTIQLHFSAFWGTFCKTCRAVFMKKISLKLPPFRKGPFLCSSITIWNNISSGAMKLGRKMPYRLLCPTHISLFDKHIIRSFQSFQCKGRLPYPPNPDILAICCSLNFMWEAWKATAESHMDVSSATFVTPNWHSGAYLDNKLRRFNEEIGL